MVCIDWIWNQTGVPAKFGFLCLILFYVLCFFVLFCPYFLRQQVGTLVFFCDCNKAKQTTRKQKPHTHTHKHTCCYTYHRRKLAPSTANKSLTNSVGRRSARATPESTPTPSLKQNNTSNSKAKSPEAPQVVQFETKDQFTQTENAGFFIFFNIFVCVAGVCFIFEG